MSRTRDTELEEMIFRQLEEQYRNKTILDREKIKRYDERIAILDKQIANPELREIVKKNLRVWRNAFRSERKQLINNR